MNKPSQSNLALKPTVLAMVQTGLFSPRHIMVFVDPVFRCAFHYWAVELQIQRFWAAKAGLEFAP